MLTKEINPIIVLEQNDRKVVGTRIEYKLFGITFYRKRMYYPSYYGLLDWEYDYRI